MLRALLVTHGDLGRSLLATARGIVGGGEGVDVLSNEGHSGEGLARLVDERLDAWEGAPGVVIADLFGGSCAQAALTGLAERRGVSVVCGANLAMLVDFLVNRERYGPAEMAARLVDKGRAGVRLLALPPEARAGAA